MDFVQIAMLAAVILGILLVLFALTGVAAEASEQREGLLDSGAMSKAMEYSFESSIQEIDKTMEELSAASKSIFGEIDEKRQELLFLYTLIDEKKNEIADLYKKNHLNDSMPARPAFPAPPPAEPAREDEAYIPPKTAPKSADKKTWKPIENPRLKEIETLASQGLSVADIAKRLQMGQGEIKLIMEIGKDR